MATARQLRQLVAKHGFVEHDAPGFVGFHRTHPDGRRQQLHAFWWENAKHAATAGIPRSYMVLDLALGATEAGGRFRLPLVSWPAPPSEQPARPWTDVAQEFEEVFIPIFDEPENEAQRRISALGDRYAI